MWQRDNKIKSGVNERFEAGKETTKIRLEKGARRPITFGGGLHLNMQTSGPADSRWLVAAIAKIENAYLTK